MKKYSSSTKKRFQRYGIILWLLYAFYTVISYLIFLRDDFILERISVISGYPALLTEGRKLAKLLHVNSLPTPLLFLILTAIFTIYAKALFISCKTNFPRKFSRFIIFFILIFMATSLVSFPSLSTDIFDYVAANRVLFVHHANPWLFPPQEFTGDDFMHLGSWKFRASVYGSVQFLFSSIVHSIAGDNIVLNILGFKLINSAFTIGTLYVIKKWLEKYAPQRLIYGIILFGWNPILHIEVIGNAHNDIIMGFFIVLGIYWLWEKKFISAAIALTAAVLAKLAALLIIPVICFWLVIKKKYYKETVLFLLLFLALTLIGFISMGEGLRGFIYNLSVQFSLYLRSFPTILRYLFLKLGLQTNKAIVAEKFVILPIFSLIYTYFISRIKKYGLLTSSVSVMFFYLLIAAPMLQPWYLLWFFPLVALLPPQRIQFATLIFSFSSLLYYPLLFTSYYFSPLDFIWQVGMFSLIVVPPLILWIIPKNWYTRMVI